jgi:hypothetical protein
MVRLMRRVGEFLHQLPHFEGDSLPINTIQEREEGMLEVPAIWKKGLSAVGDNCMECVLKRTNDFALSTKSTYGFNTSAIILGPKSFPVISRTRAFAKC